MSSHPTLKLLAGGLGALAVVLAMAGSAQAMPKKQVCYQDPGKGRVCQWVDFPGK